MCLQHYSYKQIINSPLTQFSFLLFLADSGGTIVLVGQDGVQRPPIHFPNGGHLLAFLTCLETGLLPNGQLDPPLWAQKGKGNDIHDMELLLLFYKNLYYNDQINGRFF